MSVKLNFKQFSILCYHLSQDSCTTFQNKTLQSSVQFQNFKLISHNLASTPTSNKYFTKTLSTHKWNVKFLWKNFRSLCQNFCMRGLKVSLNLNSIFFNFPPRIPEFRITDFLVRLKTHENVSSPLREKGLIGSTSITVKIQNSSRITIGIRKIELHFNLEA